MDLSWVKDLAERSNHKEEERRRLERQEKEEKRRLALSTAPLMEKLFVLISSFAEEFNKHVPAVPMRITATRVQKRTRGTINPDDPALSYADETCSFMFTRNGWTYGIRGTSGLVEFLEVPNAGGSSLRLEDVAIQPSAKLIASMHGDGQQIVWTLDSRIVDGQAITQLCADYFKGFIEKTDE